MKKQVVIVSGAFAAFVLGYPAASWTLGQQVEAALDESYQQVADSPNVKVVKREYQRGVFGATEVVTFELFGNMAALDALQKQQAAAETDAAPEAAPAPMKPIQLTFRSEIKHGPLLGFSDIGAAVADTELLTEGEFMKDAAKFLGGKKPLVMHTVYGFDGSGVTTAGSPAFTASFAAKDGQGTNTLTWEGFNMELRFEKSMKSYVLQAEMPKLEIKDHEGGGVLLSGMQMQSDQKRLFDDTPMLYAGNGKVRIGELSISSDKADKAPIVLKQIAYEVNAPVEGDFLNIGAKIGADQLRVGEQSFGPVHYDFSLNHLHARTVADLYRAWMKLYSDPATMSASAKGDSGKVFATLKAPLVELLKHDPEIRIDRISFSSKHGEARMSAQARLKDTKPEDFAMPQMLLARLSAGAEVSVPEGLVAEFSSNDSEENATPGTLVQQLAAFEEHGFISRENGIVKAKVEFANGQLTVNGKPFMPGASAMAQ